MAAKKRVLVVGGTGFLGYYTILEFLRNGWEATALGLPPGPPSDTFPAGVKLVFHNFETASDLDLLAIMQGHVSLVFAAGMDDRTLPKKPAYPKFHHANVEIPVRLLKLAKQAGIEHAVVFGSYFAYFHRRWPELKLAERHPYIRSRVEQEKAVTSIPCLDVDVLELPYIFGDPVLQKPLWTPLIKYIRVAPLVLFMQGGSACITAGTVAKAAFCAIERGLAGTCYPIGQENLTWTQMLTRLARAEKRRIKVLALPSWIVKLGLFGVFLLHEIQGKESGLNPRYFASLQTAETFVDPEPSQTSLGYELDDLDEAFLKTVGTIKK